MWKLTFYGLVWVCFMLLLHTSHGEPCCENKDEMYLDGPTVRCLNTENPIKLYNVCSAVFSVDPTSPTDSSFLEDEPRKRYTFDNVTWSEKYCSGVLVNKSDPSTKKYHAMVCFDLDAQVDSNANKYIVYATCQMISIVFIISTLTVYLMLPELQDLQGKCVMCFILSLAVGYTTLSYMQLPFTAPDSNFACVCFAFMAYFWLLSSFFWLHINSFNVWRSAVLAHIQWNEKKLLIMYILVGWGLPLLFLAVAITTQNMPGDIIKPNFGVDKCWFHGNVELWSFFYGPVAFLLIGNIFYFIFTAIHVWSDYRNPAPIRRIQSLRVKFLLYLKLFLAMGVTWIFEIVSFISVESYIWYFTDILNCLQGVIIFIVMIATRKRVRRALARRKPCGLVCNKHWETIEDDETENPLMVDETQLENGKAGKVESQ